MPNSLSFIFHGKVSIPWLNWNKITWNLEHFLYFCTGRLLYHLGNKCRGGKSGQRGAPRSLTGRSPKGDRSVTENNRLAGVLVYMRERPPSLKLRRTRVKRWGKSPPVAVATRSAVHLAGCKAKYILIEKLLLLNETARFVSGCTPGVRRGRLQGSRQQWRDKINDKGSSPAGGGYRTRLTGLPFFKIHFSCYAYFSVIASLWVRLWLVREETMKV